MGNKFGAVPDIMGWLAIYVIWVVQDTFLLIPTEL